MYKSLQERTVLNFDAKTQLIGSPEKASSVNNADNILLR